MRAFLIQGVQGNDSLGPSHALGVRRRRTIVRLLLSSPMCKQCKKCLLCILIEDLVGPLVGLSQRGGDFDLAHDRIVKHRSNFGVLL